MRLRSHALYAALLLGIAGPAAAQEDPFPLEILLEDTRRSMVVEAVINPDDTATVTDTYVTDVPPAGHLAVSAQLLVEYFDRTGAKLGEKNAWNPRYELWEGEDGRHTDVIVEGETGEFDVPLGPELGSVRISNQETTQTIATVDVRIAVAQFCTENASDPNCAGYVPGDVDGDGVLDPEDNCPSVSNPGQEDVLDRGVGDACARPGDFDGNGHVDWMDLAVMLVAGLNQPATGPGYDLTPLDLTGEGTINIIDVRRAILLCDRPSCQTQVLQ